MICMFARKNVQEIRRMKEDKLERKPRLKNYDVNMKYELNTLTQKISHISK